jgi:magnesium transporter
LLTLDCESLISIARHVACYRALEQGPKGEQIDTRQSTKLVQRDGAFLSDHAAFLSDKIDFLLDATLGLINLERT